MYPLIYEFSQILYEAVKVTANVISAGNQKAIIVRNARAIFEIGSTYNGNDQPAIYQKTGLQHSHV